MRFQCCGHRSFEKSSFSNDRTSVNCVALFHMISQQCNKCNKTLHRIIIRDQQQHRRQQQQFQNSPPLGKNKGVNEKEITPSHRFESHFVRDVEICDVINSFAAVAIARTGQKEASDVRVCALLLRNFFACDLATAVASVVRFSALRKRGAIFSRVRFSFSLGYVSIRLLCCVMCFSLSFLHSLSVFRSLDSGIVFLSYCEVVILCNACVCVCKCSRFVCNHGGCCRDDVVTDCYEHCETLNVNEEKAIRISNK